MIIAARARASSTRWRRGPGRLTFDGKPNNGLSTSWGARFLSTGFTTHPNTVFIDLTLPFAILRETAPDRPGLRRPYH